MSRRSLLVTASLLALTVGCSPGPLSSGSHEAAAVRGPSQGEAAPSGGEDGTAPAPPGSVRPEWS
ncbi:hypothetical protein [Streptomyces sp. NPDC050485]|uniref:hypothetical protein n=1 Tax=Streptomyces sp. NPDC050485 TaxID=3365617 RepID=UPI003799AB07